jgi:hypothetical protein
VYPGGAALFTRWMKLGCVSVRYGDANVSGCTSWWHVHDALSVACGMTLPADLLANVALDVGEARDDGRPLE